MPIQLFTSRCPGVSGGIRAAEGVHCVHLDDMTFVFWGKNHTAECTRDLIGSSALATVVRLSCAQPSALLMCSQAVPSLPTPI